jgi:hypothetical protein
MRAEPSRKAPPTSSPPPLPTQAPAALFGPAQPNKSATSVRQYCSGSYSASSANARCPGGRRLDGTQPSLFGGPIFFRVGAAVKDPTHDIQMGLRAHERLCPVFGLRLIVNEVVELTKTDAPHDEIGDGLGVRDVVVVVVHALPKAFLEGVAVDGDPLRWGQLPHGRSP